MRQLHKYYIKTYGCQMNELDTEVMAGILERRGMERCDDEAAADLLIFNTCSVRDLAERKVLGKLGKLGRADNRDVVIGITGCMANAKKEALLRKVPHLDFVLGTNNIHELDAVLDDVLSKGSREVKADAIFVHELDYIGAKRDHPVKASVSIIRGCNKFCTYCVVPYTRGPEVSRDANSIIEEVKKLAGGGIKEVLLLGQNVNSYGKDRGDTCLFHDLLGRIDKVDGIERVRYMTSHPVDITRELMEAHRDLRTLCEFVHFPVQAGSDRILKKMHRIYTLDEYMEKVRMLREIVPHASLGTDIIVGFPTETDDEFQQTYDILKEVEYSVAFIFAYSARQGTPAKRWVDDIPEEVKQERLQRLLQLQDAITIKQLAATVGSAVEVLVERPNYKGEGLVKGRTRCWKKVIFPGDDTLIGTLQKVKIDSFNHETLVGTIVA